MDKNYLSRIQTQQTLHQISSQFNGALTLDSHQHDNETEVLLTFSKGAASQLHFGGYLCLCCYGLPEGWGV